MLQEHKKKTNIFIGIAFLIGLFANVFIGGTSAKIIVLSTIPLWVLGSYHYAVGKGYSSKWGVLGLFPILGIVLIFFPDRNKQQ